MSNEPDTHDIYLVVFENGVIANMYLEEEIAIETAKYHYELEADGVEIDHGPVWVIEYETGHLGHSEPIGMFPDRRGTGEPGEWVRAHDDAGDVKKNFPLPKNFGVPGLTPITPAP